MAKLVTIVCDECQKEIQRFQWVEPLQAHWHRVLDPLTAKEYDFCSLACVKAWADRANEVYNKYMTTGD